MKSFHELKGYTYKELIKAIRNAQIWHGVDYWKNWEAHPDEVMVWAEELDWFCTDTYDDANGEDDEDDEGN